MTPLRPRTARILALYREGVHPSAIAEIVGCTATNVWCIISYHRARGADLPYRQVQTGPECRICYSRGHNARTCPHHPARMLAAVRGILRVA